VTFGTVRRMKPTEILTTSERRFHRASFKRPMFSKICDNPCQSHGAVCQHNQRNTLAYQGLHLSRSEATFGRRDSGRPPTLTTDVFHENCDNPCQSQAADCHNNQQNTFRFQELRPSIQAGTFGSRCLGGQPTLPTGDFHENCDNPCQSRAAPATAINTTHSEIRDYIRQCVTRRLAVHTLAGN
jgi:hypothetical protein